MSLLQVNKMWVHEGRFYNYAKPGATEYSSTQSAQAAVNAARAAAEAIHGLGRVRLQDIGRLEAANLMHVCSSSSQPEAKERAHCDTWQSWLQSQCQHKQGSR
jgi:hypothetical protein